jgi:plastocyanin
MRRGPAVVAVVALALAIFASARPTDDAHAATACVKHTKRVVKHVQRHGKRTRVVRIKHYWTCQEVTPPAAAAPTPPPVQAPPAEPPVTPPTPAPEPEREANAVSVTAREGPYSYVPSRPSVHAGRVTVQLRNEGADPHDMAIQRIGEAGPEGAEIDLPTTPGRSQSTESIELQPGHYRMWCTLYHHAEEGMETTITVE